MTRGEKLAAIEELKACLRENDNIYVTDISGLDAAQTADLRRACFKASVSLSVVKNTLLKKAMADTDTDFEELYAVLKGNSALMLAERGNAPARVIQNFRKKRARPVLKAAFIHAAIYKGDEQIETLVSIKSKEELIGDVIAALQSGVLQVISALKGQGQKLSGILKTLSEQRGS
ncbi:MAG: 50S ribosomal protein L10 [Flavobacteriales bacterium]